MKFHQLLSEQVNSKFRTALINGKFHKPNGQK